MLTVEIPEIELYDEETSTFFINSKKEIFQVEHSLISISKWESKWTKPFLSKEPKTLEETIDYIKCMTITQNVNPDVYKFIPTPVRKQIEAYIDAKMTASWFKENPNTPKNSEVITSELVYYWMISLNIPFECQKWHFNRLLALIRVCNVKNSKPQKTNRKEMAANRTLLNQKRHAQHNLKG